GAGCARTHCDTDVSPARRRRWSALGRCPRPIMASMSPPTEAVGQARRRRGRSALPAALTLRVEVLEQLVCRKLHLLVPRLRGSVRAGDQPHPVDPTEVAVARKVVGLRRVETEGNGSRGRILDARENRCHHRTTGLVMLQL